MTDTTTEADRLRAILEALAEADSTERAADIAVDFVLHVLAGAIGVSDWQVCDGTETWDGDVAGTVYNMLRAGGVLDKETDETAMVRAARAEAERDAARAEVKRFRAIAEEFVRRFEAGEVRSVRTYTAFKAALAAKEGT